MKPTAAFLLPALIAGAISMQADPTDDAIVAAMKLSANPNYSWKTTVSQNSRKLEIHGKTGIEGYALVTFVGYTAGAGGASSGPTATGAGNDAGINTVFLNDNKYVVQSDKGWTTPSVTSSPPEENAGSSRKAGGTSSSSVGGGRSGGRTQRNRSGGGSQSASTPTPASTVPRLPTAINYPHEELALIASNYSEMHFEGGVVSGKLTEFGADQLLVPPATMKNAPDNSTGTFRLWITDGAVTKYELKLTADQAPAGTNLKGSFSETITVELTDIGTTTVEVPAAAKLKLGS
jgi:hypothetical protein